MGERREKSILLKRSRTESSRKEADEKSSTRSRNYRRRRTPRSTSRRRSSRAMRRFKNWTRAKRTSTRPRLIASRNARKSRKISCEGRDLTIRDACLWGRAPQYLPLLLQPFCREKKK